MDEILVKVASVNQGFAIFEYSLVLLLPNAEFVPSFAGIVASTS
jgi:hypothetical protein